ncbi:hypothetical protein FH972_025858 [Carpinus fangiana]|uniref:dAMP1 SANT/Myb-like domain-containing protein n=1 Tax=Carpinus fangiana TaxID=176857 RepID=A0A5N6L2B8_9ROSI|nr:hypothetical protein FH972_025858 [Carpinus fangiana]
MARAHDCQETVNLSTWNPQSLPRHRRAEAVRPSPPHLPVATFARPSREVRDMLGLGPADQAQQKRPSKKAKAATKRPGERQPPIPIVAAPKQYKAKLQKSNENVRWRETSFVNPARRDALQLKHWVRTILDAPAVQPPTQTIPAPPTGEGEKPEAEQDTSETPAITTHDAKPTPPQTDEYRFTQYNLQADPPKYTDEEYSTHLVNSRWSREETDYLMELYKDFYGKWPLIVDRWEFQPVTKVEPGTSESESLQSASRSMEDLKSRFYEISAKIMAVRTPVSNMTAAEFEDHEKMIKFNPEAEAKRKRAADTLQHRSAEDRKEEEYLVAELRRIWNHQDRFAAQLKELRERLDHSLTDDKGQAGSFSTHAEIFALYQKVVANHDKNRKRRPDGSGNTASPANAASGRGNENAAQLKRQSTGGQGASGPSHRQLGPRQEQRFGVTTVQERNTPGVAFRSDKLAKIRQAKSQAQTKKIADVLAELGVPEVIQMPTDSVTVAMESLVAKVHLLLEARKDDTPDISSRPGTRNGKRSASELSESSNTATKRQRK